MLINLVAFGLKSIIYVKINDEDLVCILNKRINEDWLCLNPDESEVLTSICYSAIQISFSPQFIRFPF